MVLSPERREIERIVRAPRWVKDELERRMTMAKKKEVVGMMDASNEVVDGRVEAIAEVQGSPTVPTFTLSADQPGHFRALMAAVQELPNAGEALATVREFEMYVDARRAEEQE